MKRIATLTFPSSGTKQTLGRNQYDYTGKGKRLMGLLLKMTVPFNNTSGGAVVMTDAQKQAALANFLLTISYGKDGQFKPFLENVDFTRVQREARYAYGVDFQLYTDGTTGFSKSCPNSATTNLVLWARIPLGRMWFLDEAGQRMLGMGRSQARSLQVDVTLNGVSTSLANFVISPSSSLVMEVYPDMESCKGDQWGAVPYYRQFDTAQDELDLVEGLPLRISERSAVHASSLLTSFSLKIDDEVIHESMDVQNTIQDYNDAGFANAPGSLVDRETILYALPPQGGTNIKDLPTGKPNVRQVVKTLNPFQLSMLYLPKISDGDIAAALETSTATGYRPKTLKAVSLLATRGVHVASRTASVMGAQLTDKDDQEFEKLPGWKKDTSGEPAKLDVPASMIAGGKALVTKHGDEKKAAAGVVKDIASLVPGGVPTTRGLTGGRSSNVANHIDALISG